MHGVSPRTVVAWLDEADRQIELGQPQVAEQVLLAAIRQLPAEARLHLRLGVLYHTFGNRIAAESAYRRAIELNANCVDAINNLGVLLRDQGRPDLATECFRRLTELEPTSAEAWYGLAVCLRYLLQIHASLEACRHAIELDGNLAEAHELMGQLYREQGDARGSIQAHRRAVELRPSSAAPFSHLLLALHYDYPLDSKAVAGEHRLFAERFEASLRHAWPKHVPDRNPDRPLRVGYVSPDFRRHSVACFMEPILRHHDRRQVEVFCYAQVAHPDEITARLRQFADHWRDISRLDDIAASECVLRDRIDILVDLAGHTADNRLAMFARKPAPIQLSYLGYPDTTGLSAIDYRVTDASADPPGQTESLYSETLLRLPHHFLCYRPPDEAPPVSPPPSLASGIVTFGSFGAMAKLNRPTLSLWAGILKAVSCSRLVLKNWSFADASVAKNTHDLLVSLGLEASQIELLPPRLPWAEHMADYAGIDIALDTYPYHGTTTTCEALWMGVPVVTLAGPVHVSRVGVSLLSAVGLPDLIAHREADYHRIAEDLATNPTGLTELRSALRSRMAGSPLCDATAFCRDLEQAYRTAWRRWCAS